jgi:hypothetical protein
MRMPLFARVEGTATTRCRHAFRLGSDTGAARQTAQMCNLAGVVAHEVAHEALIQMIAVKWAGFPPRLSVSPGYRGSVELFLCRPSIRFGGKNGLQHAAPAQQACSGRSEDSWSRWRAMWPSMLKDMKRIFVRCVYSV